MTRVIERAEAHHLAALVMAIRPDWQEPGVLKALAIACDLPQATDAATVIHAAVNAASDKGNRTPAVIGMGGRHWVEHLSAEDRRPVTSGPLWTRCDIHRHGHVLSDPNDQCNGRSGPPSTEAVAAARDALRQATPSPELGEGRDEESEEQAA